MATCLITVAGTSGSVLINYIDAGSVPRSLVAGVGPFYLNDTGTSYTWSKVSGDATASSLCVTLTEVVTKCYIVSWELPLDYKLPAYATSFDSIILGDTTYNLNDVAFPYDRNFAIATSINSLGLESIKATAFKKVSTSSKVQFFLIIKVLGTEIPYIKVKNPDGDMFIYLKGVYTANCLPAGYTAIDVCEFGSVPAT